MKFENKKQSMQYDLLEMLEKKEQIKYLTIMKMGYF